jgi:hypothetical protein
MQSSRSPGQCTVAYVFRAATVSGHRRPVSVQIHSHFLPLEKEDDSSGVRYKHIVTGHGDMSHVDSRFVSGKDVDLTTSFTARTRL